MNKWLLWIIVGSIGAATVVIAFLSLQGNPPPKLLEIGMFAVTALTFVALVIYANDTNRMARISQSKWERETLLDATYEMVGPLEGTPMAKVIFKLHNPSRMIIRAKVWAEFKVYGIPVDPGDPYNGTNVWILYPQQVSQGWYSIEDLLSKQGKSISQMRAESTSQNEKVQLTMDLTIESRDEQKNSRKLPKRSHFFSFENKTWVPDLTRKDDDLWENG
jgi:hypothetical protein